MPICISTSSVMILYMSKQACGHTTKLRENFQEFVYILVGCSSWKLLLLHHFVISRGLRVIYGLYKLDGQSGLLSLQYHFLRLHPSTKRKWSSKLSISIMVITYQIISYGTWMANSISFKKTTFLHSILFIIIELFFNFLYFPFPHRLWFLSFKKIGELVFGYVFVS